MAHVFRYIGKFRKSTMYINKVVDILRAAILFCLLTIVPTTAAAQFAPVVRGGCTPHLTDGDSTADGSRRQAPLRLASINTNWDSTRVYRQAVILISFSDQDFKEANPQAFYDSLFNAPGFNKRKGPGCVADYFRQQSGGLFNLEFDVYGPVRVSSKAQPYSKPTENTRNYGSSVLREATLKVIDSLKVDFSQYVWRDSRKVNQVIYVYAGLCGNQASEKSYGHIWPNTSSFASISTSGVTIANYTCSGELWANGSSCGIGTICHEFTHSLGLPDIYPTTSDAGYSMVDEWDLMDGGNFTNYGWCPPNYTAMEKLLLGWLTPEELTEPTTVKGMKTVDEGGPVYRIKHSDSEWLLLENRQQSGWDKGLPGKGLVIYHVYYDKAVWSGNSVNNNKNKRRFELMSADNMDYDAWMDYVSSWAKPQQYAHSDHMNSYLLSSSAYPWVTDSTAVNNELTAQSVPATVMNYPNLDGETVLDKPVTDIVQNADGTISFRFMGGADPDIKGDVNSDGYVDVADVATIISFMAETIETITLEKADVNGDGSVDVADISTILTLMAGIIE